jgi:hypothetical protein
MSFETPSMEAVSEFVRAPKSWHDEVSGGPHPTLSQRERVIMSPT